ncbi:hypothetical protein D3C85_1084630 [compost metagenome]
MGRGTVLRRDVGVDHGGLDRLQNTHLLGLPQVTGIDGQQQVGGGILALGLDALHQGRFLVGDELDLHAGLGGIGVEYRLDQLVDPRGIDHHLVGRLGTSAEHRECQCSQELLACEHGVVLDIGRRPKW